MDNERSNEPDFKRVIGRNTLLAMGFGSMIGFGWVVLAGSWVVQAGGVGAILAFLIGGTVVGFIGLTYAELMCAMPKVGGEHHYAWRAIGPKGGLRHLMGHSARLHIRGDVRVGRSTHGSRLYRARLRDHPVMVGSWIRRVLYLGPSRDRCRSNRHGAKLHRH